MLMLHEKLAELRTCYHESDNTLSIRTGDDTEYVFELGDAQGRTDLEVFMQRFMPALLPKAPRLLEAPGHMFTDKAEKYISLINLGSLRELENRWGEALNPLRFRANVYIDGAEPFSELDWVGRHIRLGNVNMQVMKRNGRCAATNVNPLSGVRDRNIPGKLRSTFGHKDLGVYLEVLQQGELREGDPLTISMEAADTPKHTTSSEDKTPSLICTACYYLFDPGTFNSSWHSAGDLPQTWRCPDCGSGRESVTSISGFNSA